MSLQIQMIGTGSAFSKKFYNNNALVFCNGFTLLIDCGATAPRALYELNIPLTNIDGILITHIHADHVGGMEEFAFRLHYAHNKHRMKLFVPSTLLYSLWNHSLRGGLENKAEGLLQLEDYFEVIILEEAVTKKLSPNLTVELIPSTHIPEKPSYSLLLNEKVFYSSDAKFDEKLLIDLHTKGRCDYILHDCQFATPGIVHACLDELLTLPESIQEKVMLMHYDDKVDQYIGMTGKMTFMKQYTLYDFP
ncbi:MBL fold metallo-hydrolase [Paenibacillus radicis (ex Xue et al. 2023)]|uniref:MBL fold metallo-hydrolase n=1 Tax=Paenibacillus radicis (ex Xue et al. 2023) TaxID=2972489 RepID=A0ABT1YK20_9BACL|nr:MBL fold metallo-hydrolase [Paenibacillus radicis (ex Xue et al. 2023)]MCR8633542.1 MBL fold metallo-hydrolase [Paenibacillus radicis (ex Xue et al. 2023)]